MTEYDKIVLLAASPMLIAIVIGMIWDLVDWIKHKYRKRGSMRENGKICCNCRHNIRTSKKDFVECHCDIDNHYIGYIACMEHWCRHWEKEKEQEESEDKNGRI